MLPPRKRHIPLYTDSSSRFAFSNSRIPYLRYVGRFLSFGHFPFILEMSRLPVSLFSECKVSYVHFKTVGPILFFCPFLGFPDFLLEISGMISNFFSLFICPLFIKIEIFGIPSFFGINFFSALWTASGVGVRPRPSR